MDFALGDTIVLKVLQHQQPAQLVISWTAKELLTQLTVRIAPVVSTVL
jgi:hypothetical protein